MTTDRSKHPLFDITIDGTPLTIMADSGSSINILEERDYNKLSPRPTLERTRIKVYPYQTETPLPVLGQFTSIVASETVHRTETFYVVKGTSGSLLSWRTSTDLELLRVVKPITHQDTPTVAQPHRRVPFLVRKQLESQLSQDEELGVIERVEVPTLLVSPIVVAPKPKSPGKVRVCVDMRRANTAVRRERHLTPTIKEIIGDLNGATVFGKLDLNMGYNQLELAPES